MTDPDPSEAYELMSAPAELRGPPTDWFMVTCNGIPMKFFPPKSRHLAEHFISDPEARREFWERRKPPSRPSRSSGA